MKGRPCFTTNSSPPTARGPSRPTRGRRARTIRISSCRGVRSIRRCATSSPSADGAPATSSSASSTDKCHCAGFSVPQSSPSCTHCNLIQRGVWRAYLWIHTNSLSCSCFRGMFRGVSRNYKFQIKMIYVGQGRFNEKNYCTGTGISRVSRLPRCLFTGILSRAGANPHVWEKRKRGRCFTAAQQRGRTPC